MDPAARWCLRPAEAECEAYSKVAPLQNLAAELQQLVLVDWELQQLPLCDRRVRSLAVVSAELQAVKQGGSHIATECSVGSTLASTGPYSVALPVIRFIESPSDPKLVLTGAFGKTMKGPTVRTCCPFLSAAGPVGEASCASTAASA